MSLTPVPLTEAQLLEAINLSKKAVWELEQQLSYLYKRLRLTRDHRRPPVTSVLPSSKVLHLSAYKQFYPLSAVFTCDHCGSTEAELVDVDCLRCKECGRGTMDLVDALVMSYGHGRGAYTDYLQSKHGTLATCKDCGNITFFIPLETQSNHCARCGASQNTF